MSTIPPFASAVLENQPFSRLLGTKLTRFDASGTELVLQLRDDLKQQHGFAHGGVVSYLADNAIAFAAGAVLGANVVVAEFKINYVLPARGEQLLARAHVLAHGRRQAVCRCEIFTTGAGGETLCALAQGTVVVLADGA